MKPLAIAFFLILAPLTASAQTVTLDSVSAPTACDTAQVTVYYTASGTFGEKNVFSVQFSEDSTFNTFSIAGQLKSTASGSISITVPHGTHWVRVAASTPTYLISNVSQVAVRMSPESYFSILKSYVLTGDNILFQSSKWDSAITFTWNFGDGATPAISTDTIVNVSYNTTGRKTISLTTSRGNCSSTSTSNGVYVYTCSPSIPSDALIDSTSYTAIDSGSNVIWVVPGGTLNLGYARWDTVFAEPGATITGSGNGAVIYLKAGAVLSGGANDGIIIYQPGASLGGASGANVLQCSSLSYDYSNAPTYRISWIAGVTSDAQSSSNIRIYPNPAANLVTIESPEIPQSVVVRNGLGEIMLSDDGPIATLKIEFDVSRFAPGVYYVELTTGNGRSTLKFTISR